MPKGKDLILVRRGADNALVLEYDVRSDIGCAKSMNRRVPQGAILGAVKNDFVGRELLLAYFSDSNAISPSVRALAIELRSVLTLSLAQIKESVAAGFERILTPPV